MADNIASDFVTLCRDSKYKEYCKRGDLKYKFLCERDLFPVICDKIVVPIAEVDSPIKEGEKCILVNTKKSKYYTVTYDPSNILAKITSINKTVTGMSSDQVSDLLTNYRRIFDFDKREGCCNCIAISLYFIQPVNNFIREKYLNSIRRSIQNVKVNLPDWLVRVYLDASVYQDMEKLKGSTSEAHIEIVRAYNYIISADNVEVYTYMCASINDANIAKTRTYRFLPISDPDVNVRIIREADGIVSNLDCHNIKVFSKSDRVFYFVPISNVAYYGAVQLPMISGYSRWMVLYKYLFAGQYFFKKGNMLDILAGIIGLKLRVKPNVYKLAATQMNNAIEEFIENLKKDPTGELVRANASFKSNLQEALETSGSGKQFDTIYEKIRNFYMYTMQQGARQGVDPFSPSEIGKDDIETLMEQYGRILKIGFDEIVMLHLFRDAISVPFVFNIDPPKEFVQYSEPYKDAVFSIMYAPNSSIEYTKCFTMSTGGRELLGQFKAIFGYPEQVDKAKFDKIVIRGHKNLIKRNYGPIALDYLYFIDSLVVASKIPDKMLNICTCGERKCILDLVNIPYDNFYDPFYGEDSVQVGSGRSDPYYSKYVKYKSKYLQLKGR
jgi:hypothetical protein